MSDENQVVVPPSFLALFSSPQARLLEPMIRVRQRYELCEDLAQHLSEQARAVHQDIGLEQLQVLRRMHQGLAAEPSTLSGEEAVWVTCRLAELAGWAVPSREQFDQ